MRSLTKHFFAISGAAAWTILGAGALTADASSAARTYYLPCSTSNGARELALKTRPSSCLTLTPRAGFAGAVNLTHIQWRGWGAAKATATAVERGFHRPLQAIPVTVTADRIQFDCAGRRYYSHLVARSRYGTSRLWLAPGCVYPEYRLMFRDKVRSYLGESSAGIVRVDSDTACTFGAPGRWRCSTTAEAPDGCAYSLRGHFNANDDAIIDVVRPTPENTLDCSSPPSAP